MWVLWRHDRDDYAKIERFGVYDPLAATDGVVGRFRIRVLARHRGPARAEDEISKLVFYERLIVSGSLTGAALARE